MLCEKCRERQATVHITQVVNDQRIELFLCEACYQKEAGKFAFFVQPDFTFQSLLAGFLEANSVDAQKPKPAADSLCPGCGMNFTAFSKGGQLGCGECYAGFGRQLEPVLRRIHGNTNHVGKVPRRTGGLVRVRKELADLKARLQEAVAREAYEEAAQIRDEIRRREQELG